MFVTNDSIVIKGKELLQSFPLTLPNNGIILITGPNGCGKTLYLKNIFNKLINKKINVKYIDQGNATVLRKLDVNQNIYMDLKDHDPLMDPNLTTSKLSGGERRFISLLRGLESSYDILLIDEPTNDLDYDHVNKLCNRLEGLKQTKLFIIISHDDRIEKIADCQYQIKNHQLQLIYDHLTYNDIVNTTINRTISKKLIYKSLHYNYFLLLTTIATIIILFYNYNQYRSQEITYLPQIEENRIDVVFYGYLDSSTEQDGVIPLNIMKLYAKDEIKLSDIDLSNFDSGTILYNINSLHSTNSYDVYKIEYWNPKDEYYTYTTDQYLNLINFSVDDYYISLKGDQDFDYHKDDSKEGISLNQETYNQVIDSIENDSNNRLIHAVVILKDGVTFEDFLKDEQIQNIDNENLCIYCNQTIDLENEIYNYTIVYQYIKYTSLFLFTVHLFEIFIIFAYMKLNDNNISIFKNYGVNKNMLKRPLRILNNSSYLKELIILTFIGYIIQINGFKNIYINLSTVIILELMIFITGIIKHFIINYYLNKVYSWRFRK